MSFVSKSPERSDWLSWTAGTVAFFIGSILSLGWLVSIVGTLVYVAVLAWLARR